MCDKMHKQRIPCRSGSPDRSTELVSRHRTGPINRRPAPWGSRPPKWFNRFLAEAPGAGHVQSRVQSGPDAPGGHAQSCALRVGILGLCPVAGVGGGHVHSRHAPCRDMSSPRLKLLLRAGGHVQSWAPTQRGHVQSLGPGVGILGLCPMAGVGGGHVQRGGPAARGDSGPRQPFRRRQTWTERGPMQS